jgi:phosphonate transport system substrate-binding protein
MTSRSPARYQHVTFTAQIRRVIRKLLAILFCLVASLAAAEETGRPIRFGLTPVIVADQAKLLEAWRTYLQKRLGRPVTFVVRENYSDTMELIKHDLLDFAWVSDYPYVTLEQTHRARLLVTPIHHNSATYHALLIVPVADQVTTSIFDLEGKIFAYADANSFTGYLVPRSELQTGGKNPAKFFRKTFFTHGHQRVVEAVAIGLANGGMVDGFIWESLARLRPSLTEKTRIVAQSGEYGFPPIVARQSISPTEAAAMRKVLIDMADDREGAALLADLNIDGFADGDRHLYDEVLEMMKVMGEL